MSSSQRETHKQLPVEAKAVKHDLSTVVPMQSAALPAASTQAVDEKKLEQSGSFDTALTLFASNPQEAYRLLLLAVVEGDVRAHLCLTRMILVFHFGRQVVRSEWVAAEEAALSDSLKPFFNAQTNHRHPPSRKISNPLEFLAEQRARMHAMLQHGILSKRG